MVQLSELGLGGKTRKIKRIWSAIDVCLNFLMRTMVFRLILLRDIRYGFAIGVGNVCLIFNSYANIGLISVSEIPLTRLVFLSRKL